MHRAPLLVAGTIFGFVALVHLYRLYSHFSIVVGTTEVPSWVNIVAAVVAGTLSFWMFSAARCRRCDK